MEAGCGGTHGKYVDAVGEGLVALAAHVLLQSRHIAPRKSSGQARHISSSSHLIRGGGCAAAVYLPVEERSHHHAAGQVGDEGAHYGRRVRPREGPAHVARGVAHLCRGGRGGSSQLESWRQRAASPPTLTCVPML